jgi:hypothetical protein
MLQMADKDDTFFATFLNLPIEIIQQARAGLNEENAKN